MSLDLGKLRNSDVTGTFQAIIGLSDDGMDRETMITTYNTVKSYSASELHGKKRCMKKNLFARDILDLCDERRDLMTRLGEQENQHLQLCMARTALSDSVIRSAKIG